MKMLSKIVLFCTFLLFCDQQREVLTSFFPRCLNYDTEDHLHVFEPWKTWRGYFPLIYMYYSTINLRLDADEVVQFKSACPLHFDIQSCLFWKWSLHSWRPSLSLKHLKCVIYVFICFFLFCSCLFHNRAFIWGLNALNLRWRLHPLQTGAKCSCSDSVAVGGATFQKRLSSGAL